MSSLIACPNCRHEIAVNDALEAKLSEQIRHGLEAELQSQQAEVLSAKKQIADRELSLKQEAENLSSKIAAGIDAERAKVLTEAKKAAVDSLALEMNDQATQLSELRAKLPHLQCGN